MQSLYGAIANTNKKEIMVRVDNVYQKVLALANKEQRGYITPQEFNLFADHAQMDIFEQYFYDLEQRQRGIGNEFDYADIVNTIEEKISMFEISDRDVGLIDDQGNVNVSDNITDLYRLGSVKIAHNDPLAPPTMSNYYPVEHIQIKDFEKYKLSPLALFGSSMSKRPVYTKHSTNGVAVRIQIHPHPTISAVVRVNYIRKPNRPNWTYVLGGSGSKNALFNSSNGDFQDFELHPSEENNLVIKILQLAGVAIKDFNLVQAAAQNEVSNIQQEKQ